MSWIRLEQDIPFEEAVAEVPSDELFELNGQTFYVKDVGEGPAVVLLHGFASSAYSFREIVGPLSESFRVLAIDLNGFGLTQRPSDSKAYRIENQADSIREVLDAKGLSDATMIGHSYGAAVSAVLAARHSEIVRQVVLVSPPSQFAEKPPWYVRNGIGIRVAFFLIRALLSNPDKFHELSSKAFHVKEALPKEVSEVYRRTMLTEGLKGACFGYARAFAGKGADSIRYAAIPTEVMLIVGEKDEVVDPESCVEVADSIERAELVQIPDCGHCPPEERPAEVLACLIPFLKK